MNPGETTQRVREALGNMGELLFAYLHGSALTSEQPHDVDVAVYMDPAVFRRMHDAGDVSMEFAIPLEMRLEKLLGIRVDVQVLNSAPLGFRFRAVSSGVVVLRGDEQAREEFECLTRVEYFDFQPRRREYLAEALA